MSHALWSPFVDNEFMVHALLAGILVSIACAIAGTFVVLRGLAFVGDAMAHGVLPGIAAAMLMGIPTFFGAAVGAAALMGGVALVTKRSRLSADTAIGVLFVAMLALGVIITSRSSSFSGDITRMLFGDVLGTMVVHLWWQAVAAAVIGVVAFVCRRPFLLLIVDPDIAETSGFPSNRYNALMLGTIAITVLSAFTTVGTLLVFGMLIAPAATAALVSRRLHTMMAVAAAIGVVSSYVGLLLSYHYDIAAGASIVCVATSIFFIALLLFGRGKHAAEHHPSAHHHHHHHDGTKHDAARHDSRTHGGDAGGAS